MTAALTHRGPDDAGHWFDIDAGLALGHRRLAIVDLSPQGHQPMVSSSGRYVIVFNGEIYNHRVLRQALDHEVTVPWRGHSDTETLLAAIQAWGLERALDRSVGMFALALWDKVSRTLVLARDRLGEKPLYYGLHGGGIVFASELGALRPAPGFVGEIDRDALALYLRYANVPAPYAIYRGVHKLPPGSLLRLTANDLNCGQLPEPHTYWSVADAYKRAADNPFQGDDTAAIDQLEAMLSRAVADMSLADVPLGAFLSGGIDSSTIVALMQKQSARPVKTFTIGFDAAEYNEAEHAKQIAKCLHTDHTELYLNERELLDAVPAMANVFSEPFADSSQIPTYLVSRLARKYVAVSLSGDAGDELFYGYERYRIAEKLAHRLNVLPHILVGASSRAVKAIPVRAWDALFRSGRRSPGRRGLSGDRLHKLADMMARSGGDGFYQGLMMHWADAESVVPGSRVRPTVYDLPAGAPFHDSAERFMCKDLQGYLPDDILTKVDRAAMAVSLETRVPMLDHRVVEFALSLPMRFKYRDGQSKWLLRRVLGRHVPIALFERPKMGFAVPLSSWLRGPLREWAEDLLSEHRLRQDGFFGVDAVRRKWAEHLSGYRDWQRHLWDVLMFQAWHAQVACRGSSG